MTFKKLPGVLSFQRCLLVTDGLFYNVFEDGRLSRVPVIRHGIRGTQNINRNSKETGSTREEISNIQTTDSAKLDPGAEKLRVRFDLRFLDLAEALFACAPGKDDKDEEFRAFRDALKEFCRKAKDGEGLKELSRRYARNLANGRFLWRNRAIAERVEVHVFGDDELDVRFNALDVSLNNFGDYSAEEKRVARRILDGLRGVREAALRVEADIDFGVRGALEVFPSQNYLEQPQGRKKTGGFARSLYCVGDAPDGQNPYSVQQRGQAALRDQKIGNALRTIDTWYPTFKGRGVPIPVEPNGASLDAQEFFRNDGKNSGFKYMLGVAKLEPDTPEGMFLTACLIRGGVFSEKLDESKKTEEP